MLARSPLWNQPLKIVAFFYSGSFKYKKIKKAIEHGDPGEVILKYAESHDLIIMGAGKKGIFQRVVLGHVAREICAPSPVPVILVRRHHLR